MNYLKKFSIFTAAFLVGIIIPVSNELRNAESSHCPVNSITENKEIKAEFVEPVKIEKQPVFDVEEVWDFSDDNKALLETGWDAYCDTNVKSGDVWFGLYKNKNEYVLNPTEISVQIHKDEEFTWEEISFKTKKKPMFLVKNFKNLKKGKVKTLFHNFDWGENDNEIEPTNFVKGFAKEFSIGENHYILSVKEGFNKNEEPILVLLLENGERSQIIGSAFNSEENFIGNLNWAGDLDNDGKLDFFMEYYLGEKCAYSTALFLSSEAENGNLVKKFGFSNAP